MDDLVSWGFLLFSLLVLTALIVWIIVEVVSTIHRWIMRKKQQRSEQQKLLEAGFGEPGLLALRSGAKVGTLVRSYPKKYSDEWYLLEIKQPDGEMVSAAVAVHDFPVTIGMRLAVWLSSSSADWEVTSQHHKNDDGSVTFQEVRRDWYKVTKYQVLDTTEVLSEKDALFTAALF